jgi:hypothetical protein
MMWILWIRQAQATSQSGVAASIQLEVEETARMGIVDHVNQRTPNSLNRALDDFTQALVGDNSAGCTLCGTLE